jgi:hypothetical protein
MEYIIEIIEPSNGNSIFAACGYNGGEVFFKVQMFCLENGYDLI